MCVLHLPETALTGKILTRWLHDYCRFGQRKREFKSMKGECWSEGSGDASGGALAGWRAGNFFLLRIFSQYLLVMSIKIQKNYKITITKHGCTFLFQVNTLILSALGDLASKRAHIFHHAQTQCMALSFLHIFCRAVYLNRKSVNIGKVVWIICKCRYLWNFPQGTTSYTIAQLLLILSLPHSKFLSWINLKFRLKSVFHCFNFTESCHRKQGLTDSVGCNALQSNVLE